MWTLPILTMLLAVATMLTAPLGVKLSHRLPADKLKKNLRHLPALHRGENDR